MQEEPSHTERKPIAAFVLSLLAGLWMLMPGIMGYVWWMPMMGGRMRGGWMWHHGMMRNVAPTFWWPWFGVIAGLIVLFSAVMLYGKSGQSRGWGLVIVILSALNMLLGMGGFIASVLGLIGGALALAWRPEP